MRIIIKPIGAVFLVVALITLTGLLLFARSHTPTTAQTEGKPSGEHAETTPGKSVARPNKTTSSVIDPNSTKWKLVTQEPARATMNETIVPELPGDNKHAVQLLVEKVDPEKFWCAQMIKEVPQDVKAGKKMVVHFWGRSVQNTPVWVIFEEGISPHTPELQEKITFSPQWKQYELPFQTTRDHTTNRANFCIKAGIQPGEVEVAGIYVDEN